MCSSTIWVCNADWQQATGHPCHLVDVADLLGVKLLLFSMHEVLESLGWVSPVSTACAIARPSSHFSLWLGSPSFCLNFALIVFNQILMVSPVSILGLVGNSKAHASLQRNLTLYGWPSTWQSDACQ